MESSAANRLPEADSLPDGFVESSAEPTAPPPAAYKEALLDLDRSGETEERSPAGTLCPIGGIDGGGPATSTGFLMGGCIDDYHEDSLKDGILVPKPGNGLEEDSKETNSPRDGILMPSSLDESRVERESSDIDVKGCTELHTTDLKERSVEEQAGPLKNQKENSEAKRKVVKRNIKSEKELLEFTLNYQKAIAERDAAVAVREKLESLCRELQRQNKMLMEECQRVSSEGQNMRQDLSTKFNDAIKDVSSKLEEQKDECLTQLRENDMLRNKLKHLADQYALSEQHFSQTLKQKTLELQLADLKIQQQQEKSTQEQTQMQLYAEQVAQLMATEKTLRLQLAADGERFQQFQDALVKSNEVFEAFKQEMEKMAKLIKEFKKENEFLKDKCEKSDYALVKLVEEREHMKKQLKKVKNQKEKLESLCRSLQAERKQNLVTGNPDPDSVQAKVGSSKEDT